ncbi:peptidase M61 [Sphingosinicella sp.]|uniref:peptidase M61 n=1 Tax=Sphingosinicella sp. TaxID=1917971 RepID=UPI0035AF48F6
MVISNLSLFLLLGISGPAPSSAGELSVALQPQVEADGDIAEIGIEERFRPDKIVPGEPLLELRHVYSNVPTVARQIEVQAWDDLGLLPLVARDSGEGTSGKREWFPLREGSGAVRVRYSAPVTAENAPMGAAPPIELRSEAGTVSGSGSTFLVRPASGDFKVRIAWDLAHMGSASGLTTISDQIPVRSPGVTFDTSYFMAGQFHRHPLGQSTNGFSAAVQGKPPFEAQPVLAWMDGLYDRYLELFGKASAPYAVFMRRNVVNPGGGMGYDGGFVVTYGNTMDTADIEDLKSTITHEMFHTFQPMMISGDSPGESLASSWFNEGLAVFYQVVLPRRFGLDDADAFLRQLNFAAGRYYTNVMANLPESEVPAGFWADTRIRTLPYDRGFLFFAAIDARIREVSGGKRSLDDLMLEWRRRQDAGQPVTKALVEELLARELGPDGPRELQRVLAGGSPLPPSNAFGPCFRRVQKSLRRYELGFAPKVLTEPRRFVRDLVPGSAAERAGLRNGDEILKPVGQDRIQGDQEGILSLLVSRGSEQKTISYKPRGETVRAWQWEKVADRGQQCR